MSQISPFIAPDIAGILQESGVATRDAVQQIWLMLLTEIKARKQTVAAAAEEGGSGTSEVTFRPFQQEPPATAYAYLDQRGTHPCLQYVDGSDTAIMFTGRLWDSYAEGGLDVTLYLTSVSTSGEVRFDVSFEALAGQDIDSDGFASAKSIDITVDSTAGEPFSGTLSFSNSEIDGLVAGGLFRLKVLRDGDHANDDANTNCQLLFVHIAETV